MACVLPGGNGKARSCDMTESFLSCVAASCRCAPRCLRKAYATLIDSPILKFSGPVRAREASVYPFTERKYGRTSSAERRLHCTVGGIVGDCPRRTTLCRRSSLSAIVLRRVAETGPDPGAALKPLPRRRHRRVQRGAPGRIVDEEERNRPWQRHPPSRSSRPRQGRTESPPSRPPGN